EEALKLNVIEYVVDSVEDLLKEIDGKTIIKGNNEYTLSTLGAPIEKVPMSWIELLFYLITNPQIAYFLLVIGMYGLIHEVTHPGAIVPGVLGGTSLILAILAFNMLPITSVGIVLLILGILFMIAEIKVPGIGILGVAGLICFMLGSFLLIDRNYTEMVIKPSTYLPITALMFVILVIVFPKIYQSLRGKVITGIQGIQETVGTVVKDIDPDGKVYVHGEYWNAKTNDGTSIKKNSKVTIVDKDEHEMSLIVKRFENKN
ncbi:MAG: NfeD family protein, partial [bacterium]